jgi:ligand-binding sensor domain-containing protein
VDGALWLGSVDGALSRLRAGALERVVAPAPGHGVASLAIASDGAVLAGTFTGLFRLDGRRLVPDGEGLPDGVRVNALSWAPDGALWAGLEYRGAYRRARGGRFEPVPGGPAPGHDVNDFLFDADGTVWIATLGAGLWRWRAGSAEALDSTRGLFDDVVWRVLDDGRGHLWMSSNKGVFRVDRAEAERVLESRTGAVTTAVYGVGDGMRSRECNGGVQPAGWRASDGKLWFPTVRGVAVVDPAQLRPAPTVPVMIDRAVVDGLEQPSPAELTLGPGTARLVVGFTALAYSTPQRVRFRYRLERQDRGWNDAADERTATYTNLRPGRDRFLVQARVGDGPWGATAALPIDQRPRLAQTAWFWAVLSAGALLLVGLGVAGRIRASRARERELRERVQVALADVRRLQGLLPICAWCKKVRDDAGYWKAIEVYLQERGSEFTHAMCPECLSHYYRDDGDGPEG